MDHIGGVIVIVLTVSAMVHGFESRLDKAKNYNIDICYFSTPSIQYLRERCSEHVPREVLLFSELAL
jgi:hypothetical protein